MKLIKERGVTVAQASQDLGVHPTRAAQMGEGFCGRSAAGLSRPWADEARAAEIARLKREVAKLKAERDILKKAAAYFAKEST